MSRVLQSAILIPVFVGVVACGETAAPVNAPEPFADTTYLQVLHAVAGVPAVDVHVGQRLAISGLALGTSSGFVPLRAGTQAIEFRPAGASQAAPATTMSLLTGDSVTVFTIDSSSVLNPWVLTDSGATVPATASKLRVVHFAAAAPAIDVWRTQPDFPTLITVQFPFPYQVASPYLQSDPGIWTVLVTTERRDGAGAPVLGDSLAATGEFIVPAGESRTVVVTDRAGGGVGVTVIAP